MDNQIRIDHILSNLSELASGNFNIHELAEIKNDSLDAIDRGIVMLGEYLEFRKNEHDKSIEEKEILLKEIHHRVKNNLQIISSLLNLQSKFTHFNSEKSALKQSQLRINTISIVHDMLYKSTNISRICVSDYVNKIVRLLVESFSNLNQEVSLVLNLTEVSINLDTAVTLGILINEIVTNSLTHGIEERGEIYIQLKKLGDSEFELKIGDNGKGFIESSSKETLGLLLINTLSEQLEGKIERRIDNGTHYTLIFKGDSFEGCKEDPVKANMN